MMFRNVSISAMLMFTNIYIRQVDVHNIYTSVTLMLTLIKIHLTVMLTLINVCFCLKKNNFKKKNWSIRASVCAKTVQGPIDEDRTVVSDPGNHSLFLCFFYVYFLQMYCPNGKASSGRVALSNLRCTLDVLLLS